MLPRVVAIISFFSAQVSVPCKKIIADSIAEYVRYVSLSVEAVETEILSKKNGCLRGSDTLKPVSREWMYPLKIMTLFFVL